jgi:hypothetical protein
MARSSTTLNAPPTRDGLAGTRQLLDGGSGRCERSDIVTVFIRRIVDRIGTRAPPGRRCCAAYACAAGGETSGST